MIATAGTAPQALIILGGVNGQERTWYSHDSAILVTRHGRVIRSAGLVQNLTSTRFLGPDPLASTPRPGPVVERREVDITPGDLWGIPVTCVLAPVGPEDIRILGVTHHTIHLREHCAAPVADWRFDNQFWQDPRTGHVWKSVQILAPSQPPITLMTARPVGS